MRYVIARIDHPCSVCKETIHTGDVCIQSQSFYGLFYHEDCHTERFGGSIFHKPGNEKPEID